MKIPPPFDHRLPAGAEQLLAPAAVDAAVERVAAEISAAVGNSPEPLLALVVMRGGLVFAGHLLSRLRFPLTVDYVDASRYGASTEGGALTWRMGIPPGIAGRTVLVIDDILDAGLTLAAIRDQLLVAGALRVLIAVFADKQLAQTKPVTADFVGVTVPDRYVFGFGMDVHGLWRNLHAVYALPHDKQG